MRWCVWCVWLCGASGFVVVPSVERGSGLHARRKKKPAIVNPDGSITESTTRRRRLAQLLTQLTQAQSAESLTTAIEACLEFGLETDNPAIEAASAKRDAYEKLREIPPTPNALDDAVAAGVSPLDDAYLSAKQALNGALPDQPDLTTQEEPVLPPQAVSTTQEEQAAAAAVVLPASEAAADVTATTQEEHSQEEEDRVSAALESLDAVALEEEEEEDERARRALDQLRSAQRAEELRGWRLPEALEALRSQLEACEAAASAASLAESAPSSGYYFEKLQAWQNFENSLSRETFECAESFSIPTEAWVAANDALREAIAGDSVPALEEALKIPDLDDEKAGEAKLKILKMTDGVFLPEIIDDLRAASEIAASHGLSSQDPVFVCLANAEKAKELFEEGQRRVASRESAADKYRYMQLKMEGEKTIEKRRVTRELYEKYLETQRELAVLGEWYDTAAHSLLFQLTDQGEALVPNSVGRSGTWTEVDRDDLSTTIQVDIGLGQRGKPCSLVLRVQGDRMHLLTTTSTFLGDHLISSSTEDTTTFSKSLSQGTP